MNEMPEADLIQSLFDCISQTNMSYEEKMRQQEMLEPVIEVAYDLGLTQIKPLRLMTADDLDFPVQDD
jgi:hypothetical protein